MSKPTIVYQGSNPNGRSVVIRKNIVWDEYVVQFFDGAEYLHICDYFTPHWEDAHQTATLYLEGKF